MQSMIDTEMKPCPFCGASISKMYSNYLEHYIIQHPKNNCFVAYLRACSVNEWQHRHQGGDNAKR